MKTFIYLIVPAAVMILWLLSRNTRLPPDIKERGISRELYRTSLFIYKTVKKKRCLYNTQKVRGYLAVLSAERNMDRIEADYFAGKISIVLVMAVAGSLLALAMTASSMLNPYIEEGSLIKRNAPGERKEELELVAIDEEGGELGEFDISVGARLYTKAEAQELFEEAVLRLGNDILGENESLEHVTKDLSLVKKQKGYPFEISWEIDNYDVMHSDGSIIEDRVPIEGAVATLTATYRYNDDKWQQVLYAHVKRDKLTGTELLISQIEELIKKNDDSTKFDDYLELPDEYQNGSLVWKEKDQDSGPILLLLMLLGGMAAFILKDRELKKKIDQRNAELLREYPQFISQLVLYLGAGMTMRNIFMKLSDDYVASRNAGAPSSYMYEEVLRTTRQLQMGQSEAEGYESFGYRCGGQQYVRLSTLLAQNLRKGNSELLTLLSEETKRAFDERLENVRKEGEEAGTKLLLPMMLMLMIVMVIIMIPAYMTF